MGRFRVIEGENSSRINRTEFIRYSLEPEGHEQVIWLVNVRFDYREMNLFKDRLELDFDNALTVRTSLTVEGSVSEYLERVSKLAKGAGLSLEVRTHNPPFPPMYNLTFGIKNLDIARMSANNPMALAQRFPVDKKEDVVYRVAAQTMAELDY